MELQVYGEDGKPVFEKPFSLFENGESYPKSKKLTVRFQPGKYTAILQDGDDIHEKLQFEIAPKNFTQFNDETFAKSNGVNFEDSVVVCKLRIIADQDGYVKLTQISRSD